RTGHPYGIHNQSWPVYDAEAAKDEEITLVIQVNGKVRDRVTVPADITEEEAKATALASDGVNKFLNGNPPKQVIYIAKRGMINIVL
ncbi:MAG TPA: leucine--tRNA ligase, partial [Aggregatilineales bacterium]|nr:leucine--tRNA ligase [Aggregatilineales bacterium]